MQNYGEIVNEWYQKLDTPFKRFLKSKFLSLSYDDIEDIYQDTFLAVYDNIAAGRMQEATTMKSYIFAIGFNKAMRRLQKGSEMESMDALANGNDIKNKLSTALADDGDKVMTQKIGILETELNYIPEPCSSILKLFYYDRASMDVIAATTGLKNSQTAKSKKNQCMNKFKARLKNAFRAAGLYY